MSVVSYFKNAIPSWWTLVFGQRPDGNIAVLSTVWAHHAKRSGYHPIAKGLGVILPLQNIQLIPTVVSRWIAGEGLETAYQIALAMKATRCDHLLVVDGDFQLKLIKCIRRVTQAKISAVFHQVPKILEESCLAEASPLLLDGAVCVARCQIPLIQSIAPAGKTWFVPHGVDANYFTPGGARADRPTVLCVGVHYRDFETLQKSADLITQVVPSAVVRLIAPRAFLPSKMNLGPVELVSNLTDEQLLTEYRRAWVVLLPLNDSTANNSLLEGMACGTPVVVSDIGGVRDYVEPECGALCPSGDPQAHAGATIDLLLDSFRREAAGQAARARASLYAWPIIREQIRLVLRSGTSEQGRFPADVSEMRCSVKAGP
jgi:glycosyltransferase involved in cell wall biosynthesis